MLATAVHRGDKELDLTRLREHTGKDDVLRCRWRGGERSRRRQNEEKIDPHSPDSTAESVAEPSLPDMEVTTIRRMRTAIRTALFVGLSTALGPVPPGLAQTPQTVVLQAAPTDMALPIPLETLKQDHADMDARKLETLRILEGGRYNVNIRRITNAETALVHPVTADVWVVTEGAGTLTVNGRLEGGKIVGGTSRPLKAGDVIFVPAGVPHGVSGVTGSITWLNIRFDTNYPPAKP